MSWSSILNSLIVGTERGPLPEMEFGTLGLSPSSDAAQTALGHLAAANLARKAGFQLRAASDNFARAAAVLPDTRPLCSEAAAQDLKKILSGLYANALPEFLDLLAQNNLRLPPEFLPNLLENAERDTALAEKTRPALGARGEWLARQNPRWEPLLAEAGADWFTAPFAERKRLLAATRARNPLLALAWLEKTWPEEKAEHKVQFIGSLHIRLSLADEGLLEKAFSDKNREVRWAALQALALLPESRVSGALRAFFKERLAGIFRQEPESFLKKSLPDLAEEALNPWFSLLSKSEKSDWRNGLLRLFVGLLPPGELLAHSGLSREQVFDALDRLGAASALLEAVARHRDGAWAETALRHFSRDFRHSVWQSGAMAGFLALFAVETMAFLQKNNLVLGFEHAPILRALENYRRLWPRELLENLLEQYRRPAWGRGEIPGWHFAAALQTAAYHCAPADAVGSSFVRDYLQNPPPARLREFEAFLATVRFRLGMRGR